MQIYQILNTITNKSYIGKSKNYHKRFETHIKHAKNKINRRLYDSINYHGIDCFKLILLEDLGECTNSFANNREIYWINKINTLMPNGYNMTIGGDGGYTLYNLSDIERRELYKRQAEKRTGMRNETIKKIHNLLENAKIDYVGLTNKEKKLICRRILKAIKKGIKIEEYNDWVNNRKHGMLGKHHSIEAKNKISNSRIGKKYDDFLSVDSCNKMRELQKNRFSGIDNPKYVEVTLADRKIIIDLLMAEDITVKTLSKAINKSEYIVRKILKEYNIQQLSKFTKFTEFNKKAIIEEIKLC